MRNDCTGASGCSAKVHIHGCYADLDPANCEEPAEHGHRFRIAVVSSGSGKVVGDPKFSDSNWWSDEHWAREVRAWDLPSALRAAAEGGLGAWETEECPGDAYRSFRTTEVIRIHFGDLDDRAEAFNDGFETAMAQVATAENEEEYAYDWLQEQKALVWDEAIHHIEAQIGGSLKRAAMKDNPYREDTTVPTTRPLVSADGIEPHPFEAYEGATGYTCTSMVMRDGGGDQCGLPPRHPLHATE